MADTTAYTRGTSFTDAQAANPVAPPSGPALDGEFDRIRLTTDSIAQSLDLIQRDDGRLLNGIVGVDAIDPAVYTGLKPAKPWAAGVSMARYDTVMVVVAGKNQLYRAETNHLSTDFAADLAAGKWTFLVDYTLPTNSGPWLLVADLTLQQGVELRFGATAVMGKTSSGIRFSSSDPVSVKFESDIGFNFRSFDGAKISAFFHPLGAQTFFYDGAERLRTVFDGAKVTGALAADTVAGAMRVLTGADLAAAAAAAAPVPTSKVATPAAVAEYVTMRSAGALGVPGQVASPSGEIVKRGTFSLAATDNATQAVVLPAAFPVACDFVRLHLESAAPVPPWVSGKTANGFTVHKGPGLTAVSGVWEAVGH